MDTGSTEMSQAIPLRHLAWIKPGPIIFKCSVLEYR